MARWDLAKAFGFVVRTERTKQGVSQEKLAEKADIHRNYMGMLERGECSATLDVADQVARALGMPLEGLIAQAAASYEQPSVPSMKTERTRARRSKRRYR